MPEGMEAKEVEGLFEKKLSKEEKKAAAAVKKAERDAKKAAKADEAAEEEPAEAGPSDMSVAGEKKAARAAKAAKAAEAQAIVAGLGDVKLTSEQVRVAANRAVTGVLSSSKKAWDVKFESVSLAVGGNQLLADSPLELNQGCRYGLIGENGSGKSNLLAALAQACPDSPLNRIDDHSALRPAN